MREKLLTTRTNISLYYYFFNFVSRNYSNTLYLAITRERELLFMDICSRCWNKITSIDNSCFPLAFDSLH